MKSKRSNLIGWFVALHAVSGTSAIPSNVADRATDLGRASPTPPSPVLPTRTNDTVLAGCQADNACGHASTKILQHGVDIEVQQQRGTFAGYEHGDQDAVVVAVDDDAAQTKSLYNLNGTNQWVVRRMGYHSAQSGSGVASIIEAQVYNGVDRSQGVSPSGRREYGALLVGTSAYRFDNNSYSTGGNWWNIDSNSIGPVQANAVNREQWLSGGVFFVKKRAPGLEMDTMHDGAVGILIASTPAAGAGDAVSDAANGRRTFPLNAGVRVHGWSGPQSATGGNAIGATPMAKYGLWVGGVGGNVWSGYGPRALFNEGLRSEDFDTFGLHLLNGYGTSNAAFVEQSAGGIGIWQAPQREIPLLVGADEASGLSASLFGAGLAPTTLRITRFSTAPKAGDALGQVDFRGFTRATREVVYARLQSGITESADERYTGSYRIITAENGTLAEAMKVEGTQTSLGGLMTLAGYKVNALPSCDQTKKGSMAHATDVISVSYNTPPVGGGEHDVPVYCDGKRWSIH